MLTILKAKARAFWEAVFADEPETPTVEYVVRLESAKPKRKAKPRKKASKAKPKRKARN